MLFWSYKTAVSGVHLHCEVKQLKKITFKFLQMNPEPANEIEMSKNYVNQELMGGRAHSGGM